MPIRNLFIAIHCGAVLLAGMLTVSTAAAAGEDQMTRFGCYACHRVGEKLIGPAFRDVAARYRGREDTADYLFAKIRAGGEGVWGDIPMVPNTEEKIPDEELKSLIAWIRNL